MILLESPYPISACIVLAFAAEVPIYQLEFGFPRKIHKNNEHYRFEIYFF